MRRLGVLAAAILAACLFLVPAAQAGCTPGEGDCPLEFPQSEQVNPDPTGGASLRAWESVGPGSAAPVVLAMPLPRVVPARVGQGDRPPAPVTPLPVPMRYQDPANSRDVSCGIQALGMALDGLGGATPTSAALAGFLDQAGMLYEYGTGVEELALAAQAHGYAGSLAVHGATLDDLRAQLGLGHPVVVALGTSGEGQPGHFVTVTGISEDGAWVSYNDPALGPLTIPASKFLELWARQGNSGVFVAREAPVAPAGEPVDALPWVALMAGVMALVSATPWGSLRPGVGGRVDAGGAGGGKKASPAPAPKSAPKPAPKPAPKARFDDDPPPAPARATPAPAPKARFDEEPDPVPVKASPPPAPRARFDDEPDPPPRPAATATAADAPSPKATPTPAPKSRFDDEPDPAPRASATPTPMPTATRTPMLTPSLARTDTQAPPVTATPTPSPAGMLTPVTTMDSPSTTRTPYGYIESSTATLSPQAVPTAPGTRMPPTSFALEIAPPDIIRWDTRALKLTRAVRLAGQATGSAATSGSLVASAFSPFALGVAVVASVGTNLYDYGMGEHKDEGVGSEAFWVSTAVDFALPIAIGVLSAAAVGLVTGAVVAAGVTTAAAAAPVAVLVAAVLAVTIAIGVDFAGTPSDIKAGAGEFVDERQEELERLQDAPVQMVAPKGPPVPLR